MKFLTWAVIGIIFFLGMTIGKEQLSFSQSESIENQLKPCIPQNYYFQVITTEPSKKGIYYFLELTHQAPKSEEDRFLKKTVVELDSIGCFVTVSPERIEAESLTYYIPLEPARNLALKRYQQEIERLGGQEKLQQEIAALEGDGGTIFFLFPEQAWALQQLGIKIPKEYQIVEDISQLTYNGGPLPEDPSLFLPE